MNTNTADNKQSGNLSTAGNTTVPSMKIKDLNKIEFLVASFLYGFAVLMLISNGSRHAGEIPYQFSQNNIRFGYLSNYFLPQLFQYSIIYFSFLLLNFCCLPQLYKKVNTGFNVLLLILVYLFAGLVISIGTTYSSAWLLVSYDNIDEAYNQIFFKGFTYSAALVILVSVYSVIKNLMIRLTAEKTTESNHAVRPEIVFGAAFWFIGMLIWIATAVDLEIIVCWTLVIGSAIFLISYSIYTLIPEVISRPKAYRAYFGKLTVYTLIIAFPIGLAAALLSARSEFFFIVNLFQIPVQLAVSGPLAWYIYKTRNATNEQIFSLKMELGKSDANLGFLKSQINPHFLFNALNTLYGTALQENAERTGEGIQKLGDMMRFMLQENVQDKISLSRDIDYLNNYIALQKLRTSVSVAIVINTEIEEQFTALQISPMLLIPFVENAFKHGISLQSPSHIKVTLQTKGKTLYFDVNNSIHLKADDDPERLQSGIGLENVKQRLSLLYPDNHELIIRESAKEFFVHLTLNLD